MNRAARRRMKSSGPVNGYNFASKQEWRRRFWARVDQVFFSVPKRYRKVAILDTREGLETLFLIRLGYCPHNIYVINRSPVEVALLTKRLDQLGIPRVNTRGTSFVDAVEEWAASGVGFDIVNFDQCSGVTDHLLFDLQRLAVILNASKRSHVVVGVNVLRGREPKTFNSRLRHLLKRQCDDVKMVALHNQDIARRLVMSIYLTDHFPNLRLDNGDVDFDLEEHDPEFVLWFDSDWSAGGIYKSSAGNQTMAWTMFHLTSEACSIERKAGRMYRGQGR